MNERTHRPLPGHLADRDHGKSRHLPFSSVIGVVMVIVLGLEPLRGGREMRPVT